MVTLQVNTNGNRKLNVLFNVQNSSVDNFNKTNVLNMKKIKLSAILGAESVYSDV